MSHCDGTHYNILDVMQYHHNGDIIYLSQLNDHQMGYHEFIPLLMSLGFCFGFGGGEGKVCGVGEGREVRGELGGGIASKQS